MMNFKNTMIASFGAAALLTAAATANPAIWETDYGIDLTDVTGEDDAAQDVSIAFGFDFAGSTYTNIFVGSNGSVALGGLGEADDYPSGSEFIDTDAPMLAPLWSDMDVDSIGTVYFNDFGNRAVVTWDGIGTFEDEDSPNTFQLQIFDNGKIIFGYNGIQDNTDSYFDTDIHVGITEGNDPSVNEVDYTFDAPFSTGATTLELFGYNDDDFDLDFSNIIFTPDGNGGYTVTVPAPASAALFGLGSLTLIRRRRA
jgi:hypothetical protein